MISIVWPHDAQGRSTGVIQSQLVNVSLWPSSMAPIPVPFAARPVNPFGQPIALFVAKNNEPAEPVDGGLSVLRTVNGVRFPSLEFKNIPANLAADPSAKYTFFANTQSNVWVHVADARTYFPCRDVPTASGADCS